MTPSSEVDSLLTDHFHCVADQADDDAFRRFDNHFWDVMSDLESNPRFMRNHDNTLTLLDRVMNGRPVVDLDAERKARK